MITSLLKEENSFIKKIDFLFNGKEVVIITQDNKELLINVENETIENVTGLEY